ncbi:MAG: TetR family transcriptional regulator [Sorangiineae bacterium]|nr:TetR family transcriptional regulator [Polyangiaceae bacterium]MEB2320942.1 TetR family transcriptional regulator [Sorangiineae bacterium]
MTVQRASRALSREESKLITRRRLLEAAARVLREGGHAALSTSAVTRAAGVAQPTFYVHFKDMSELVRTLAREKVDALRRPLQAARAKVALGDGVDALRQTFRLPLEGLLEQPELFRLFVQELPHPDSDFGVEARALLRELEADLVNDLARYGAPAHTDAERRRLAMMSEGMIALTVALGVGHLDGRYPDLEQVVQVLADFALGVLGALPSG